jgi:hypothetical protein
MGDSRRFDLFGAVVARNLDRAMSIADIAGGKGLLRANLYERGFRNVTSWDKRRRYAKGRLGYRFEYFDHRTAPTYDAVVAMHPDGGTDEAIVYAGERRVPAIVCPCCAIPSAATYWGARGSYSQWMTHLVRLAERVGLEVTRTALPMTGRNQVLILRPRRS